jgi:hypothetical protein
MRGTHLSNLEAEIIFNRHPRNCGFLEDSPLPILDFCKSGFLELESASSGIQRKLKSGTQLITTQPSAANANDNLSFALQQWGNPSPRLRQKIPVCLDASMAIILIQAEGNAA